MKRTILVIGLLFCTVVTLSAKSFSELYGGYNLLSMKEYNDSADKANSDLKAAGAVPKINNIESAGFAGFCAGGTFSNDYGVWAIYLKTDYLFVSDKDSVVYYSDGKTKLTDMEIDLDINYIGIGARKYFLSEIKPQTLNPYIGLDGGLAYSVGSLTKATFYYPSGATMDSGLANLSGGFFGGNIELGCEYWFVDQFGVFLKGGYRYAKGELTGKMKSANIAIKNDEPINQGVDYSGGYFQAGITLDLFGNKELEKTKTQANKADDVDLPVGDQQELLRRGDVEYNNKRYKIALSYYEDALKMNETALLYKKIGNCKYYLGNKAEAIQSYEKSLELNSGDSQLQKWVDDNK